MFNKKSIEKEFDRFIHHNRRFVTHRKGFRFISYTNTVIDHFKNKEEQEMIDYMITQMETYTKANFLKAKVFGI